MADFSAVQNLLPKFDDPRSLQGRGSIEPRRPGDLGTTGISIDDVANPAPSFRDALLRELGEVSQKSFDVRDELEKFATGESEGVHDVMLAMGKSEVAFSMMLEVRNRFLNAWREITRIQV